jgi:hypothetical protein
MPTYKRHSAPGDLQFLTSSTCHRAQLFESDRFRLLAAEVRPAPACVTKILKGRKSKKRDLRYQAKAASTDRAS